MTSSTESIHSDLLKKIDASTKSVRGVANIGQDALLFLNTRYESFPVTIQQESLISSNAKSIYNNLWLWAKAKQSSTIPASLFPGYEWIMQATNLGRATVASCLCQLRLQRYLTLHQKVRSEIGQFMGNDFILNDEPMALSDTLSIDADYINYVNENLVHRHHRVKHLAYIVSLSISSHVNNSDDPFRPATHLEKVEARQQANQVIQARLFPEDVNPNLPPPKHYFGIPIDDYNEMIDRVHKVNLAENEENTHVHKVNAVKGAEESLIQKVNLDETTTNHQVHLVNSEVNPEVNGCSSGLILKTTTNTLAEFTKNEPALIFPKFNTPNEESICRLHIMTIDPEHRQPILDELAGRMNSQQLPRLDNPIGYLKGWLIKQLNEGAIPYTSRGPQHEASRNKPNNRTEPGSVDNKSNLQELYSKIRNLEKLIQFHEANGQINLTQELIQQRDEAQINLDELRSRLVGSEKNMGGGHGVTPLKLLDG